MQAIALPAGWTFHGERPELHGRWGSPPVDGHGRHQILRQVVQGEHEGREFWAFTTPVSGVRGGWQRVVVALDAGRDLPRATLEPQALDDKLVLAGLRRLLVPATRRGVPEVERLTGPALDVDFDRHYRIRTRRPQDVRPLLSSDLRAVLLASERLSLAYDGSDVLCWRPQPGSARFQVADITPPLDLATAAVAAATASNTPE